MDDGVTLKGWSRVVQGTPGFTVQVYPDRLNIHINDWYDETLKIGQADIDANIKITTTKNNDNSITYEVRAIHWNWYRYRTTNTKDAPFDLRIENINADGSKTQLFRDKYRTYGYNTNIHINRSSDVVYTGTIKPNLSRNASVNIELFYLYNDGTIADDEAYGGITIVNTNPPDFRPGMTYYNSRWESDNRNPEGMNLDLNNGQWKEIRSINPYTKTAYQALYYENGIWKTQDKVGEGRDN